MTFLYSSILTETKPRTIPSMSTAPSWRPVAITCTCRVCPVDTATTGSRELKAPCHGQRKISVPHRLTASKAGASPQNHQIVQRINDGCVLSQPSASPILMDMSCIRPAGARLPSVLNVPTCGDRGMNIYGTTSGTPTSVSLSVLKSNTANTSRTRSTDCFIREFTNGWAVYNRSGKAQTITLPASATPVSDRGNNAASPTHLLPDLDGEIYLKAKNPADVNGDGTVNILDLVHLANNFGKSDPDINNDGVVNILDLTLVAQQFSQ